MKAPAPIAETLLEFAGLDAERLQTLDPDDLESRLQLAMLVWNAVLLAGEEERLAEEDDRDPDAAFDAVIDNLVVDLFTSLGSASEALEQVVRYLVVRKLEDYGDDRRGIAELHLDDKLGRRHLTVVSF